VENDTEGRAPSAPNTAHAVSHVDAVDATSARHRTLMNSEHDRVTPLQRHDFDARLHARTLLRQDKLTALELASGLRQQNSDLQRENVFAIEILMQAVVVAARIPQQ
jgi:hypothetical protein